MKTQLTQEGVIAGFTEPRGGRKYFGALVLGVFEGDELIYIGHAGGGFGAKDLKDIREKLEPLIQKECPFNSGAGDQCPGHLGKAGAGLRGWFSGWTEDGVMRQPVFLRLREDKAAREVVRDERAVKELKL